MLPEAVRSVSDVGIVVQEIELRYQLLVKIELVITITKLNINLLKTKFARFTQVKQP